MKLNFSFRQALHLFLVALVSVLSAQSIPATDATPRDYEAHKLCDLSDKAIDECSGLAASRRYPGLLWAHNDSGDTARLFLINLQGQTMTQVHLQGAENVDWEDIEIVGTGRATWLYVGDIGDNNSIRPNTVIYRLREPNLDLAHAPPNVTVPCERMTLTYPDGPHNAETLIALPDGNLIIVTKTLDDSQIFKTSQPFQVGATQQLTEIGKYRFGHVGYMTRLATGGDLSPDGKRLVICTYAEAYEWLLPPNRSWTALWQTTPHIFTLPPMKQCEGICYSADGQRIYLSGERLPAPLYELVAR